MNKTQEQPNDASNIFNEIVDENLNENVIINENGPENVTTASLIQSFAYNSNIVDLANGNESEATDSLTVTQQEPADDCNYTESSNQEILADNKDQEENSKEKVTEALLEISRESQMELSINQHDTETETFFNPFNQKSEKSLLAIVFWMSTIPLGVIFYFTIPGKF